MDVIGLVMTGRWNVRCIQCVIVSAMRYLMAWKWRALTSHSNTRRLNQWVEDRAEISVLMRDNAAYLTFEKIENCCKEN